MRLTNRGVVVVGLMWLAISILGAFLLGGADIFSTY